jgi:hypothetical protein
MPRFAAIPDAQGLWFVNQYTPDNDGFTQETIADRLKKAEALALAEALNAVADRWWLV